MDITQPLGNGWISFFEGEFLEDEHAASATQIDGPLQLYCDGSNISSDVDHSNLDSMGQQKKRPREDGSGSKASREKLRRDKLNDRFMELSAVLEPEKPPKADKASILHDAIRIVNQLRGQSQQLRDANHELQEIVKELKSEKNELREEKLMLKAEKDRLQNQLRSLNGTYPAFVSNPTAMHAVLTPHMHSHSSTQSLPISEMNSQRLLINKTSHVPDMHFFPETMSQWMPPMTTNTSNDHILRPPVA